MTPFEKWKERYEKGWCTIDHLKRLVTLEVLTKKEYDEIVKTKEETVVKAQIVD